MSDPDPTPRRRPTLWIVVAIVLIAALWFGGRFYLYNRSHVSTDDAYITKDIVPVNPLVAGNVTAVFVKDNQEVAAGDLILQLDDSNYRAEVDQAKANLAVAQANVRSAAVGVGLTSQTGAAQLSEAQGGLAAGSSDVASAETGVTKSESAVAATRASAATADAQARAANQGVQQALAAEQGLAKQIEGLEAAITTAKANVRVARANVARAQATLTNAQRDAARYQNLARQGAVPVATAEAKQTAAATAEAALEASRQQVAAAEALVAERSADHAAARQQAKEAEAAVATSRAMANAAHHTAQAAWMKVDQAQSDVKSSAQAVQTARAHRSQAQGKVDEAQALPKRVAMSRAEQQTALAKVKQAQAALETAKLNLARTRIVAPAAGRISKKSVERGQQVAPGQPLMAIVPSEAPWVIANFKETQLSDVRVGQAVEIDVDAFPDQTFTGHVDSIAAGTGSAFSLLPADNASGNFTKVVQRVPVKIVFDPGQANLERLATGMSTGVAIRVK